MNFIIIIWKNYRRITFICWMPPCAPPLALFALSLNWTKRRLELSFPKCSSPSCLPVIVPCCCYSWAISNSWNNIFIIINVNSVRWRDPVHETGAYWRIGNEETTEEKVNKTTRGNDDNKKRKLEWTVFPPFFFFGFFFLFRCGVPSLLFFKKEIFNPHSWKTHKIKQQKQINKREKNGWDKFK